MNITLLREEDGLKFVEISGSVDQQQVSPFNDPLADALGEDIYSSFVLMDMTRATSLDSSGVGWFLGCHKRFRENGGKMVLHSMTTIVGNTLRVLNMHMVFKIEPTEKAAVELAEKLRSENNE